MKIFYILVFIVVGGLIMTDLFLSEPVNQDLGIQPFELDCSGIVSVNLPNYELGQITTTIHCDIENRTCIQALRCQDFRVYELGAEEI